MKYNRVFTCTIFTILSLTATVGLAQITAVVSSPLGAANKALPEVRMVYLIPSDRVYHGDYATSMRSEEHTSELQSQSNLVCRLLLEKKKIPQLPTLQLTNLPLDYLSALEVRRPTQAGLHVTESCHPAAYVLHFGRHARVSSNINQSH